MRRARDGISRYTACVERLENRLMLSGEPFNAFAYDLSAHEEMRGKVGHYLTALHVAHEEFTRHRATPTERFTVESDGLMVFDEGVAVTAVANGALETLLDDLLPLGLKHYSARGPVVAGWLPLAALDEMAALESLHFARASFRPDTDAIQGQGFEAMRIDEVGDRFTINDQPVDGAGVKLGVISTTYDKDPNAATNESEDIASGDLPAAPNNVNVLGDGAVFFVNDEGRAMLQIVYDVAPAAELYFHSSVDMNVELSFEDAVVAMRAAGVDIIADDLSFNTAPMFQDGRAAQAAEAAVAEDIAFFSSAGNKGRQSY